MITNFDEYQFKKFKPGDWVTHKVNEIKPMIIKKWDKVLKEYIVKNINYDDFNFIRAIDYRLMTQKEIKQYKIEKDIRKYNL